MTRRRPDPMAKARWVWCDTCGEHVRELAGVRHDCQPDDFGGMDLPPPDDDFGGNDLPPRQGDQHE